MAGGVEQIAQIRSHRLGHIDEKWPEVMFINDYAVFMGYLSMAVTGTGFLVLTWSTVVLLGGYVTVLSKEDFWSLTVITLVQTRVFDVFLNRNITNIGYSFKRLWEAALSIALARKFFRVFSARGFIRLLVFTIVLCPLFGLYMFGLFVSPWIALWRLILQHDYGNMASDSSKENLKPALLVLYSLALLQGVLFYYRAISALEEQRLVRLVADEYALPEDDKTRGSISDYLREIRIGCEKDPSFARGRNLITYAANLMESSSPDNYLSGARILDTLIRLPESMLADNIVVGSASSTNCGTRITVTPDQLQELLPKSQRMVINNMIGSASSSDCIKKLVQMLDSKSPYDTEIRLRAMRIVAHFASEIRLNKVPYGIQCLSSFLENSEAQQHRPTSIDILWKLTGDKENLRLVSNTNGLALKIIKLIVTSNNDELHVEEHEKWCSSVALPGMEVIKRLMAVATKHNNIQLGHEILESTDAISTLEDLLHCERCKMKQELQMSVILVLTQIILLDASPAEGNDVRKRFVESLIGIFLNGSGNSSLKTLAGKSLEQLSCTEICAQLILREKSDTVDELTKVLLDIDNKYRKNAAGILKHLCSHYATGDQHFNKLKKAMIVAIPKVLREVLGCRSTEEPRPPSFSYNFGPSYYPYRYVVCTVDLDNVEVQEALASLCKTVHDRIISLDTELTQHFDTIAAGICRDMPKAKEPVVSFAALVRQAAEVVANNRRAADGTSCCIS